MGGEVRGTGKSRGRGNRRDEEKNNQFSIKGKKSALYIKCCVNALSYSNILLCLFCLHKFK